MKYRPQEDVSGKRNPYDLVPDDSLNSYDNENIYAVNTFSDANIVLELKTNIGQVPMWMIDLIKHFELKQVGFSKYMNSSLVSRNDNGIGYMNSDRMGHCY